jgi:hypothetical protein
MKRSKMVEKIANMLPETNYEWYGGKLRFAYSMLYEIEELGMLPPVTMVHPENSDGNDLCSEACVWDKE